MVRTSDFPVSGHHSVDNLLCNVGGILSEDRGGGRRVTVLTGALRICFMSSPGGHMMVVCVHACTCVFTHARVCMCTCVHIVYPHVSACVCIHGHIYVCASAFMHAFVSVCTYICTCVHMYMCAFVHFCACVCQWRLQIPCSPNLFWI